MKKTTVFLVGLVLVAIAVIGLGKGRGGTDTLVQPRPSPRSVSTTTSLLFDPSAIDVSAGSEVAVPVILDPAQHSVVGLTLVLTYDPKSLEIVNIVGDKLLTNVLSAAKISQGTATLSLATPPDSSGVTTRGTVAIVTVKSLTGGATTLSIAKDTQVVSLDQEGNVLTQSGILSIN